MTGANAGLRDETPTTALRRDVEGEGPQEDPEVIDLTVDPVDHDAVRRARLARFAAVDDHVSSIVFERACLPVQSACSCTSSPLTHTNSLQ